jgi:hypothetical protein
MRHSIFFIILFFATSGHFHAQVAEHFKEVDQILWVVEDLDHTIKSWKELGFDQIVDLGTTSASMKLEKTNSKLKIARANLGGAYVTWVQPLDGQSIFHTFLEERGQGAISLVHRLNDGASLQKEVERLAGVGVELLEEIIIITKDNEFHYSLMNTTDQGKYILGYTFGKYEEEIKRSLSSDNRHNMTMNQYAFASRDTQPASSYWHKVGLPAFQISYPTIREREYRGQSADFEMIQGWQRHGTVVYEWCIPIKGPDVFNDHMKVHGEGIQHIAFAVADMDEVIADFNSRGFAISMSGAWGEKGKPGSGRFAYVDLEKAGGLTMELLWSFRQ